MFLVSNRRGSHANQPDENSLPKVTKTRAIKKRSLNLVSDHVCLVRSFANAFFSKYPSPSIVNDRYDLGKKMGDGNFALVRRSKLRENDQEFAIKIIDKSKMKVR